MAKSEKIKTISLTGLQIKSRLEAVLSYDHKKYQSLPILFETKTNPYSKLPYSDYKVAIAEELEDHASLQENINKLLTYKYQELQYKKQEKLYNEYMASLKELPNKKEEPVKEKVVEVVPVKKPEIEEKVVTVVASKEESEVKPKRKKVKPEKVDTLAIIEKIKQEAREKNKGKKVIGRREINKMLDPFGLKAKMRRDLGPTADSDDILTSIDIYLSAVDKVSTNVDQLDNIKMEKEEVNMNIDDILKDIGK